MKFELEETGRGMSDEELLEDMRRCAEAIGRNTLTKTQYREVGRASPQTVERRFGSWSRALERAELHITRRMGITDEELFENIRSLWTGLGRQPRYTEVKKPISRFSTTPYENRFGTWIGALRAFIVWVNSDSPDQDQQDVKAVRGESRKTSTKRRTRQEISERQRFRILVRDGFSCRACGISPLRQPGVELHVDHIVPWSKGGETTDDNLETKCKQCNLGKGNAFSV